MRSTELVKMFIDPRWKLMTPSLTWKNPEKIDGLGSIVLIIENMLESNKTLNLVSDPVEPGVPFNTPLVVKDGVILVSVRLLSVVSTLAFVLATSGMCVKACWDGLVVCEGDRWPMISSVICLPVYSRVAALVFTFVMMTSNQVGMRANYARLYGKVSNSDNDWILMLGIVSCVSVPLITFFDEHNFKVLHGIIAAAAFLSGASYANQTSKLMAANKDKFDLAT